MAEIRLEFDGVKLEAIDTKNGTVLRSWPAISGRPGRQSSAESNVVDNGPIPAGDWSISTSNIVDMKDLPLWRRVSSEFGIHSPRGGVSSWGNTILKIDPVRGTNTFGRDGFHIHGGYEAGSAGCIDLVGGNDSFFYFLKKYDGEIRLGVNYSGNELELDGLNHPLLQDNPARGDDGVSLRDAVEIMEKLYDGDSETAKWFLRMSAQQSESKLNPFVEGKPAELQNDKQPKPPTEISGWGVERRVRQGLANQQRIDEMVQPAVFRRSLPVQRPPSEIELIKGLATNDIVEVLPGVGAAIAHRSKMISARLENRTNNEQAPVEPPVPRPRPKLNPITEGYLKDMPEDGRLILTAEMVGFNGRKKTDTAEAERKAHFDVQRKMAQDLEDIKVGKVSTVWDRYGHPKAVRDLLGEEAYQTFVDDRLEAGLIAHATAGLHLLQDAELFGIADGTTTLEAPHEKLAELMTPKGLAAAAERARDILDMRRTKPSEAVLLSSDLRNRKAQFDAAFDVNEPVDAEEMDAFLFYHEAAQREIGIAEPAIEMIPPRWASQVAARFEVPQAGDRTPTDRRAREAELKQHYTELQQSFGPRTDDMIAYSLAGAANTRAQTLGQRSSQ